MLLYLMGLLYVLAGVNHFVSPKFYLKIMPPYLPYHEFLVAASGLAEIVLGVMLFIPATRSWAAWGIILLLIAVFPANLYMAYAPEFQEMSPWFRWCRLPIQLLLIWWAYRYTN